jgi:hypothetical protein
MAFCFQVGYREGGHVETLKLARREIDKHPRSLIHCLVSPCPNQQLHGVGVNCGVVLLELDDAWVLLPEEDARTAVILAARVTEELYR